MEIHDFSITQILREINFEECRSAKSVISTHLEALNFVNQQNSAPKAAKMAVSELLDSPKLVSRKI